MTPLFTTQEQIRSILEERLAELTPDQLSLFNRIYVNGVAEDNLVKAIDLCDRTIRKNRAGRLIP